VFLPAALVVIASGVGLTETGNWDWGEPFIVAGLLLWAMVSLVAFGYLGRAIGRAGAQLAADGPSPALAGPPPAKPRLALAGAARDPGRDRLLDDGQARDLSLRCHGRRCQGPRLSL
jgi:hypothetical protein